MPRRFQTATGYVGSAFAGQGIVAAADFGVRGAAGTRNLDHQADEISRLFPHRVGLYQDRAWFGCWFAGELCDGDYRYRSAAERAALRALSESGARFDAGYRYRLRYEPSRRSDRIRHAQVWARAGGADHHLQHDGGEGGDQGRRPRARYAVWRRGSHREAGADDDWRDHRAGFEGFAAAAGSIRLDSAG